MAEQHLFIVYYNPTFQSLPQSPREISARRTISEPVLGLSRSRVRRIIAGCTIWRGLEIAVLQPWLEFGGFVFQFDKGKLVMCSLYDAWPGG